MIRLGALVVKPKAASTIVDRAESQRRAFWLMVSDFHIHEFKPLTPTLYSCTKCPTTVGKIS